MKNPFEYTPTDQNQTIRRRPTDLELRGRLSLEQLEAMGDAYPGVDVEILDNHTFRVIDPITSKLAHALKQIEGLAS